MPKPRKRIIKIDEGMSPLDAVTAVRYELDRWFLEFSYSSANFKDYQIMLVEHFHENGKFVLLYEAVFDPDWRINPIKNVHLAEKRGKSLSIP